MDGRSARLSDTTDTRRSKKRHQFFLTVALIAQVAREMRILQDLPTSSKDNELCMTLLNANYRHQGGRL